MTTVAGPEIKRFAEVKIGDKVTAKYYENVIVRVKKPGEPDVDSKAAGTTGPDRQLPVAPKPSSGRSRPRSPPWTRPCHR